MKRIRILGWLLCLVAAPALQAAGGLVSLQSTHDVQTTMDRLESSLGAAGFKIFARVDHAAGAKRVDLALAPTQLIIFGKPQAGTLLMQSSRTVGIDLPLKFLVWEDGAGKVRIEWNDPAWLAERHGIADRDGLVGKIGGALRKFAGDAAAP
jgi:uncharacterized protein (DUF302 family)